MVHDLDVVSVEVADEDAVVALVVLRPDSWLVQYLCSGLAGSFVYGVDGGPVGCGEGNVDLAAIRALGGSQPELREPSGPAKPTTIPSGRSYRMASRMPRGRKTVT